MRFYRSGKPIAKQRPRLGRGCVYDPQSKEKEQWRTDFKTQMLSQGILSPLKGAIRAALDVRVQIPKSWSKKRKETAFHVTSKPDIDNYEKWVLDILNKIAYEDDSQIVQITSSKTYSNNPGVEIRLFQLEDSMINEHAVTYKDKLNVEDLNYIITKANQLGLSHRHLTRVYQEEDREGTHVYFVVEGLKENGNG